MAVAASVSQIPWLPIEHFSTGMPEIRTNMKFLLVTGATGMLGHFLLRDWLLARQPIAVVVRDKRHITAWQRVEQIICDLESRVGRNLPRPVVLSGDIHQPGLGLCDADAAWVAANCDSILHVAASVKFYADDAPEKEQVEPWRSNVAGMRNLLRTCEQLGIRHFHHVSTAYVCGQASGLVAEDVQSSPEFGNDYAASKYEAEKLVRAADHLQTRTFLRPSIIVGDSQTGFTSGFHGIYTALQLGHLFLVAVLREGELQEELIDEVINVNFIGQLGLDGSELKNLVPADWVSQAIFTVVQNPNLHGQTYHLTNGSPVSIPDITTSMREVVLARADELSASSKGVPDDLLELDGFASLMATYKAYFCDDPQFDTSRTHSIKSIPSCPGLDREKLARLWNYAISVDFSLPRLPIPPETESVGQLLENALLAVDHSEYAVSHSQHTRRLLRLVVDGEGGGAWDLSLLAANPGETSQPVILSVDRLQGQASPVGEIHTSSTAFRSIVHNRLCVEDAIFQGTMLINATDESSQSVGLQMLAEDLLTALRAGQPASSDTSNHDPINHDPVRIYR